MTIRQFDRKEFEVTLVPGSSNQIVLTIDELAADGTVDGPFDGSQYAQYYCQACQMPTEEDRNPIPLLSFVVVHLPGFIPEGETTPHPGAFSLQCNPDSSRTFQDNWVQSGVIDIFGIASNGDRAYVGRGFFTTEMAATRNFTS